MSPLPLEVNRQLPDLRPVGEGRLRWFGLHIYDAALWTRTVPVGFDAEFALDIKYARNIPAARLVKASLSEMQRLGFDDGSALDQWAVEMARVFPEIRKGDRLTGVNRPGRGAEFSTTVDSPERFRTRNLRVRSSPYGWIHARANPDCVRP